MRIKNIRYCDGQNTFAQIKPNKEAPGIISHILYSILWGIVTATLSACSTPAERIATEATSYGFSSIVVDGTEFKHQIYFNSAYDRTQGGILHVYLEGDGTPWINHEWASSDPTPRTPLMLRLMAQDMAPSIYLGRPCYNGYSKVRPCTPSMWTDARYSEPVVASMAAALEKMINDRDIESLMFFGHSGGGTLAMLLAERFSETHAVITIAGNLDIDAWAQMHRYTKLYKSLNPANRPALDRRIHQLHLAGDRDTNIPPQLIEKFESLQQNSELIIVSGFDHVCCWEKVWPDVLAWAESVEATDGMIRKDRKLSR